jgi:hypothetical protein
MDQTFFASSMIKPWQALVMDFTARGRAMAAQILNDLAFEFRSDAPKVIGEHRKIRAPGFIKSRFLVEKTKPGPIGVMFAKAGSIKSDRFSGFGEDYGEDKTGRSNRSIGANARGGDMAGKAKPQNRLTAATPSIDDFADIKGAPNQRIAAMISIIARHPSVAPQGSFILHGAGMRAGVYRIKAGGTKARRNKRGMVMMAIGSVNRDTYGPAVERVQTFKVDITNKRLDWVSIARTRVQAKAPAIAVKAQAKVWKK